MSVLKPENEHDILPEPEWEKPTLTKVSAADLAQAWKAEKQKLVNPCSNPRYDDVYMQGIRWLDTL